MIAAKLSQTYDTMSSGALDVLLRFSMSMSGSRIGAHFKLLEHMLCIVVAVSWRNDASGSSSSRRCRSAGSSAASPTDLRNPCERIEASNNAAKDSLTSFLASKEGRLGLSPRDINKCRRSTRALGSGNRTVASLNTVVSGKSYQNLFMLSRKHGREL